MFIKPNNIRDHCDICQGVHNCARNWLILFVTALLLLAFSCSFAKADILVQTDRYSTAVAKPTAAQCDPLSSIISVSFSPNINTIGDAMTYLLRYTGYQLIPYNKQSVAEKIMLQQSLPWVDRHFDKITLRDALQILAGQTTFDVKQNTLHRWVYFRLKR